MLVFSGNVLPESSFAYAFANESIEDIRVQEIFDVGFGRLRIVKGLCHPSDSLVADELRFEQLNASRARLSFVIEEHDNLKPLRSEKGHHVADALCPTGRGERESLV